MACSVCGELKPCVSEGNCPETVQMVETHAKRMKVFMGEGLSESQAFYLANAMTERDLDAYDDRRICFECKNYDWILKNCRAIKTAMGRAYTPMRFMLKRCESFSLKGAK